MRAIARFAIAVSIAASTWCQTPAASTADTARQKREQELKIAEVVAALGPVKGGRVADVGAGEGEYDALLAQAVGAEGRVYAEDISDNAIKSLRENMQKQGIGNVEAIQGTAEDPNLPARLDGVLMIICYHEFTEPRKMLDRVADALRPGGRLVLVEMHPHRTLSRPRADQIKNHVLAPDVAQSEFRAAGFEVLSRDDHFIDQPDEESTRWMIVFRKPPAR